MGTLLTPVPALLLEAYLMKLLYKIREDNSGTHSPNFFAGQGNIVPIPLPQNWEGKQKKSAFYVVKKHTIYPWNNLTKEMYKP